MVRCGDGDDDAVKDIETNLFVFIYFVNLHSTDPHFFQCQT